MHQIGIPIHWGFAGESVGGCGNDLTALVAEVNVSIHEGKVFVCRVDAGRMPGTPMAPTKPRVVWKAGDTTGTPPAARPEGGFAHGRE